MSDPLRVQIVIDCAEPDQLAGFWAEALGYVVQPPPAGYESWPQLLAEMGIPEESWGDNSAVVDPVGSRPRIFFQRVAESKQVKNRVHLDVHVGRDAPEGTAAAQVSRLEGLGATRLRDVDEYGEHWTVMADPEGNEFCVS